MATIYQQTNRNTWMTRMVLLGERRTFSLETDFKPQAARYQAMLEDLPRVPQGREALQAWWDQKAALPKSQRTLSLHDLYAAWQDKHRDTALDALLFRLRDADLQEHAPTYLATIPRPNVSPGYSLARSVRLFLGEGPVPASTFTVARVEDWLHSLPMAPASRRLYYNGIRKFGEWLVRRGVLPENPVLQVPRPKGKKPEIRFLELPEIQRVLDATTSDPLRIGFLLAYGAGIERKGLLGIRRRDVQWADRMVMVRGATGKSASRERMCRLDGWAWAQLAPLIQAMLPDALLLGGLHEMTLSKAHREALAACHLQDRRVTLHCARHAWAVRKLRVGVPVEMVARQLGHANGTMVHTVYGRFIPRTTDWERWDQIEADRAPASNTGTRATG